MPNDRTIKGLLAAIAVLLALLVVRPMVETPVGAQTTATSTGDGLISIGSAVNNVAVIKADDNKAVRNVYAMDSSHVFIVQYDGYFRVYGVRDVRVAPGTTTARSTSPSVPLTIQ